jgi:signal transduction histidine kinase
VLAELDLLDSLSEESFDRYTRLAAALLRADVSLISLVDSDRQFFKSQVGLPAPYDTSRETPLTHSFCKHVVEGGEPLIVEDARTDSRVCENLAIRDLGVIAYLGMPVTTRDGFFLGSLCAIQSSPRVWSGSDQSQLADLAGAVSTEIELRQRALALKGSLDILEETEQRREEALRMLIHDLRTPAGAIVSSTELIESSPDRLTPDQLELLRTSRESAEQLLSMIRDLLEIGRMGSDETPPPRRTILVSELLRHAAQMVEPTLEAASISLAVRFPDSGSTLEVHPRSVERVLLNLLTNAGKFSPSGSTITLSARRDTVDGIEGWLFEVADAGPGVPDDEKNAVFRQHFTGSIAAERGLQSFGIGLAFCKLAVEEHGGQIGVRDAPGGGSIFFFFLPEKAQS